MVNIFAKMESEETAKRFKSSASTFARNGLARSEGKDPVRGLCRSAETATRATSRKSLQFFSDMEFARSMRALLSNRAALKGPMATAGPDRPARLGMR